MADEVLIHHPKNMLALIKLRLELRYGLLKAGLGATHISFDFDDKIDTPFMARINKQTRNRYRIAVSASQASKTVKFTRRRLETVIFWLSKVDVPVSPFSLDLSDGDRCTEADCAWSSASPDAMLVPDPYFFWTKGFAALRQTASDGTGNWDDRATRIRWRGGLNGAGKRQWDTSGINDPAVSQRIRLAMIARRIDGLDVKFTADHWRAADDGETGRPYFGPMIREADWIHDKYALDIDGWTNSWSNFLVRMHLGCCVLKVGSQFGYRQWYYDRIRPWEHYVPVKTDMSDLAEKFEWVKANDRQARDIAANGREFARTMTFESQTSWAAEAIRRRIGSK